MPEQQKCLTKLVGYDFPIVYRPGEQNSTADALSCHSYVELTSISVMKFTVEQELKNLNKTHHKLLKIQQALSKGELAPSTYRFKEGLLFYKERLVLPSDSKLRQKLTLEFHAMSVGCHAGIARNYHRLASNFFWKQLRKDILAFVATCQIFQQMKDSHLHPTRLLQPLPIPNPVFEDIAMDFITCLPSSKGKTTIMTVVDSPC